MWLIDHIWGPQEHCVNSFNTLVPCSSSGAGEIVPEGLHHGGFMWRRGGFFSVQRVHPESRGQTLPDHPHTHPDKAGAAGLASLKATENTSNWPSVGDQQCTMIKANGKMDQICAPSLAHWTVGEFVKMELFIQLMKNLLTLLSPKTELRVILKKNTQKKQNIKPSLEVKLHSVNFSLPHSRAHTYRIQSQPLWATVFNPEFISAYWSVLRSASLSNLEIEWSHVAVSSCKSGPCGFSPLSWYTWRM